MQTIENDDFFEEVPKCVPAATLPDGWFWHHWSDGSGHLVSPKGNSFFSYDRSPYYPHGIEHRQPDTKQWGPFWGTMDEFIAHAESVMLGTGMN